MNQNPEQIAQDRIGDQLKACGWLIQDKRFFNLAMGVVSGQRHQIIDNFWKRMLYYFHAFQIGLTATPDIRTFGYFEKNIV